MISRRAAGIDLMPSSRPVAICLIDTGISDEELARHVIGGVNFSGHGAAEQWRDPLATHADALCRTVLAITPDTVIVAVRALDAHGTLRDLSALDRAFAWIAAQRERLEIAVVLAAMADLTHNSSEESYRGTPVSAAVNALRKRGVLTVVPAGNWAATRAGPGLPWPAILGNAVSVGALDPMTGTPAPYSQWLRPDCGAGSAPTLLAKPGDPGGTSGAAAVVAGRLADLRSRDRSASADALLKRLLAQTRPATNAEGHVWPALISS